MTAPLDNKIILDGVTRRSILQLARERLAGGTHGVEPIEIVERQFSMDELAEAVKEGRIVEAFAAGTAVKFSDVDHWSKLTLLVFRLPHFGHQLQRSRASNSHVQG